MVCNLPLGMDIAWGSGLHPLKHDIQAKSNYKVIKRWSELGPVFNQRPQKKKESGAHTAIRHQQKKYPP